jgi:carboxyl-terminal processing protease
MTSRTRLLVLAVSTPVIAFAIIGGYLGQAAPRDATYRNLAVFEDVLSLVLNNYVEEVDVRTAMSGAMRGLADGLDPDSAFLPRELAQAAEARTSAGQAEVGIELVRQFYLRVVSTRDGSPAAKAGLRTGDYIRAIDGRATRDMTAFEGARLLQGAPGSKVTLLVLRGSTIDPHEITVTRERLTAPDVTSRMANGATGYVRVAEFTNDTPANVRAAFDALRKTGAASYVVDLRGTARGDIDAGINTARLFVGGGKLAVRQLKSAREDVNAQAGEGTITAPVTLLVGQGTAGAAEVFAAALDDNNRAELIGEHTLGRAARQQLVKLPDGSALLLTQVRYLSPKSNPIHEKGLEPDVEVEAPVVEFGMEPPTGDPALDRALERLTVKKAA